MEPLILLPCDTRGLYSLLTGDLASYYGYWFSHWFNPGECALYPVISQMHHFCLTTDYVPGLPIFMICQLDKIQVPFWIHSTGQSGWDAQRTVLHSVCKFPLSVAWFGYKILCWIRPLGDAHTHHTSSPISDTTWCSGGTQGRIPCTCTALAWGLSWSVADILSDTPLENFLFNSGYQLWITSWLAVGLWIHFPFAVLRFLPCLKLCRSYAFYQSLWVHVLPFLMWLKDCLGSSTIKIKE